MAIKFRFSVPTPTQAKSSSERKKPFFYLLSLASSLLPLASCFVLTPAALAQEAVFGVVKSEENANQWQGITTRLQAAGVAYCVVDLPSVRSTADLGDRTVLFLPNIETITPGQAIALEGWMSRGGRVIASGPVGNMSQPGVRQLLRSLLGAYWGFNLSSPSNLQPLRTKTQEWVRQNGLSGTVQGGVIIPASLTSKPAAVWKSKDSPPAVVTTDRSTVLGWNWGVNTAAPAALDSAWLRAALGRYIQLSPTVTSPGSAKTCPGTVVATAKAPTPKPTTPPRNIATNPPPTRQIAVAQTSQCCCNL